MNDKKHAKAKLSVTDEMRTASFYTELDPSYSILGSFLPTILFICSSSQGNLKTREIKKFFSLVFLSLFKKAEMKKMRMMLMNKNC